MEENLQWFNRVFEELQDEDSYVGVDDADFLVACLYGMAGFKKGIGRKYPVIELYDKKDVEVAQVCFDPANQQFYLPVYDDVLNRKLHVMVESFEEIQSIFVHAWNKYVEQYEADMDALDQMKVFASEGEIGDIDDEHSIQSLFELSKLFRKHHESQQENQKEKLENIEWIEGEEFTSSIKVDIPLPMEKQVVLRSGIIPGARDRDRAVCIETRLWNKGEVASESSQIFLLTLEELIPLLDMQKKYMMLNAKDYLSC